MMNKIKMKKKVYLLALTGVLSLQAVHQFSSTAFGQNKLFIKNKKEIHQEETFLNDATEKVLYHEILETYNEKGILFSKEAESCIRSIFSFNNESESTAFFRITTENVLKQYRECVEQKEEKHRFAHLYDEEKNDIRWSEVSFYIIRNSKERESEEYVSLSRDEIEYVVSLMEKYIINLRNDYSNLDMKKLACKLEDDTFLYAKEDGKRSGATAHQYIFYYDNEHHLKSFDFTNDVSIHEFFHLVCDACDCFTNQDFQREGIHVSSLNQEKNSLNYTFIEEAAAEKMKYNYFGILPNRYQTYQRVVDNIEFALSLNDHYSMEHYVEASIYHDPIGFIKDFPVGNENVSKNFTDNVRMLVIYDALLRSDASVQNSNYVPPLEQVLMDIQISSRTEEEYYQNIANLINYSQSQLTKLFFANLVFMSENNKESFDEDYYLYLVNLFHIRMRQSNEIFLQKFGFTENRSLVTDAYEVFFDVMQDYFANYLKNTYSLTDYERFLKDYRPQMVSMPFYAKEERLHFFKKLEQEITMRVYDVIPIDLKEKER